VTTELAKNLGGTLLAGVRWDWNTDLVGGACAVLVEGTVADLLLTETLWSSELTGCVEEFRRDTTLFGSLT